MSYRFMRIIVFFDLPTLTKTDIREYTKFRKFLIKSGFVMMQQSVYSKITLNQTAMEAVLKNVRKSKPPDGLVQVLCVTEKQFSRMEYIIGDSFRDVLDTDDRLVLL